MLPPRLPRPTVRSRPASWQLLSGPVSSVPRVCVPSSLRPSRTLTMRSRCHLWLPSPTPAKHRPGPTVLPTRSPDAPVLPIGRSQTLQCCFALSWGLWAGRHADNSGRRWTGTRRSANSHGCSSAPTLPAVPLAGSRSHDKQGGGGGGMGEGRKENKEERKCSAVLGG